MMLENQHTVFELQEQFDLFLSFTFLVGHFGWLAAVLKVDKAMNSVNDQI